VVANLVLAAIAVAIVAIALIAGRIVRARQGAGKPAQPDDKPGALFVSMFPELQPHFHPEKLVAYVAARRGRTPARGGFTWKGAPGFGGPSVDIRFVGDREECSLVDAAGTVLVRFRFESHPDGGVLRVGAGKFTVNLKDDRDPAVRYWHPDGEFKWSRRGGWRFKTPIAEKPFVSSDSGTSWSESSSSSDGMRTAATAAGVAGLGGTFDGGGASGAWDGAQAGAAPEGSADSLAAGADSPAGAGSESGDDSGSDSGSTSY